MKTNGDVVKSLAMLSHNLQQRTKNMREFLQEQLNPSVKVSNKMTLTPEEISTLSSLSGKKKREYVRDLKRKYKEI